MDRLAVERAADEAAYTESRQQRLLTTQVNAALKKLDDLQAQYADDTDSDVKNRLTEMQQALDSILPGSEHSAEAPGFKPVGTSASQLRRERSALSLAIGAVSKGREAIERTANSASDGSSRTPLPPASATPSTAQTSSSLQEQTLAPSNSGTPAPQQPSAHPLSMVRVASPTRPPLLSPEILAGFVCGLLYLGSATLAYRRAGTDEAYPEESPSPQRLITPMEPVHPLSEEIRPANVAVDLPATRTEPAVVESAPRRRASFAFGAPLVEGGASRSGEPLRNNDDEASDPLTEQIRKTLSETSIGRMFEGAHQDAARRPPTEPPTEFTEPQPPPGELK
jgi:hypothetical protein